MSHNLQRVESAETVARIARANRVSYSCTPWAASVTLGTVCYFWSAA